MENEEENLIESTVVKTVRNLKRKQYILISSNNYG